jgi:cobalt/nickel transport protein
MTAFHGVFSDRSSGGRAEVTPLYAIGMLAASVAACCTTPALAHFQSIYTPEANFAAPATFPVGIIFWHPLSSGVVMDMTEPQEFFVVHNGIRTDLLDLLKPARFTSWANSADGFKAEVTVRSPGDYIFALVPRPYLEETEDRFIQQYTKMYVNRGQLPTEWDKPVGLKAEIVPFQKPYNAVVGASFSGQVLYEGQPVPGAEIEVEYIAGAFDMGSNATGQPTVTPMPGGAITLTADPNGVFTFGISRAGWWGFAALNLAPGSEYQGKDLSEDAVIWVNASDLGMPSNPVAATTGLVAGGATQVALASGLSPELEDAVGKAIRDQLRPIRTDLAMYRAETSYPVTLGGIGFIVGLSGLGFYLYARQRARQGGERRA